MSRKLILALALAVVLVSGVFAAQAQAECCGCLPHISMPCCNFGCGAAVQPPVTRDYDRPYATCQGAYQFGPTAPWVMSTAGL